eukprot:251995-Alexandrium_andersonii.AAC.1
MSASLVGSEMCIRDSPPRPSPCRRSRHAPRGALRRQGRSHGGAAFLGAVSYTHLTLPTICSV